MDLKFKGKTWVGNIYQKFEAMCQEVDDFVSQDPVKYVENQVQTVGESVKKLCSDVVQDFLPPSLMDPVKCEAEAVPRNHNDAIGAYIRSMIGLEEKPVYFDIKQSSVEQDPVDPLENHHASSFSGPFPAKQFIPPPTPDPFKEAESDLSLGQDDDALAYKNSDMGVEENFRKEEQSPSEELSSPEDKDSSEALSFNESVDDSHKKGILAEVSPATSVHGAELRSSEKEGTVCKRILNEVEHVSNVSSTLQSSMAFSIVSCENKIAETALISSSSSLSTESYSLSEFSHANLPSKAEKICYNPTDAVGCGSDLSDAISCYESFPTVACDNKVADRGLAFSSSVLSLESIGGYSDVDTFRTDEAVSVAGSSGNKHEQCCDCTHLEAFMSSLESGQVDDSTIDIADPSMESIDLSDKVKLDESCVIVDSKLPFSVSCRARKLRSYKKIIQDAFGAKKRLTKEYEQLAIWYGDVDIVSSWHTQQNLLPSIPTMPLESKKSLSDDICDLEWELL